VENFKRFSMDELAASIDCPTKIFIGQNEIDKYADMKKRSEQANQKIKNSQQIIIDGVGHDVGDPQYIKAIKETLK
jgi:pimeloyl-ACP methyl ester carboxylesterase